MSTDETYNGWTNRETWAVALYINNDQGLQESVLDAVRDDMSTHAGETYVARYAGETIKNYIDELFDLDTHDGILPRDVYMMVQDIGSLYRVDWDEIGASFLSDVAEQDA